MSSRKVQNIQNFIIIIELVNIEILIKKWEYPIISLLISVIFLFYLWFIQLKTQPFYDMTLNNIYESLYFSFFMISIEILLLRLLKFNEKGFSLIFCFVSEIVFLVIGWFLNKVLYKYFVNKIIDRIQKKYNQQNVINQLKEQLEEENNEDGNINKSLETIGTKKKKKKKKKR
ncbi:hypothetical protein LY90DRAFT_625638 [Neocallimastix californiae]|uniref:Transmembrane protein n=1 Tax=Neocallimastix californiae TaxID=1754190 RepID=A0A1Y2BPK1_9FUNG|nr:hypothetical protein LY90DRAFT_625638 [Neocallimastix californiae]|eukprot:ORY36085.1 hypothetical protein LY90DRAFT_625638 [Neocallimastix californiae]